MSLHFSCDVQGLGHLVAELGEKVVHQADVGGLVISEEVAALEELDGVFEAEGRHVRDHADLRNVLGVHWRGPSDGRQSS